MLADGQIELALEGYEQLFAQMPTDEVLRNRVNFLRDSLHRHAPDWQVRTYVISPRAVAEAHILAQRYAEALEILEWLLEKDPSDNGLARRVAMVRAMRNGTSDAGIEPTASTSLMTPEMLVEAHLAGGDVAAALHLLRSLAHKRPHDQRLQDRLRGLKAAWGQDDAEISRRVAQTAAERTADVAAVPAVEPETAAPPAANRTGDAQLQPDPAAPASGNAVQESDDMVSESDETVAAESEIDRVTETDAAMPASPATDFELSLEEQKTVARSRPIPVVKPALPQSPRPAEPPPLPPKRQPRSVTDPKRDGYGILRSLLEDAEQALQQEHVQRVPTDQVRSTASPLQSERPTNPSKHSARRRAVEDFGAPAVSPAVAKSSSKVESSAPAASPVAVPVPAANEVQAAAAEVAGQVRGRRRRRKLRQAHDTGSAQDLVQGDPQQPLESKLLRSPLESTSAQDIELFDIHEALTAPDGRSLSKAKAAAKAAAAGAAPAVLEPVAAPEPEPVREVAAGDGPALASAPAVEPAPVVDKTAKPEDFDDDETVHDEELARRLSANVAAAIGRPAEFAAPPPTHVVPGRRERPVSSPQGDMVLPGAPVKSSGRSALGNAFEPPPPTNVLPGRRGRRGAAAPPAPAVAPTVALAASPPQPAAAENRTASDLFDEDDDPTLLDKSPLLTTDADAAAENAAGPSTSAMRRLKKKER